MVVTLGQQYNVGEKPKVSIIVVYTGAYLVRNMFTTSFRRSEVYVSEPAYYIGSSVLTIPLP